MNYTQEFWNKIGALVSESEIIIDRPKGSAHPRYPEYIYPHDYGYLKGTTSGDGDGIDCWVGDLDEKEVTGIITTIDLEKKDSEIKILISCSDQNMQAILQAHNRGQLSAILIKR